MRRRSLILQDLRFFLCRFFRPKRPDSDRKVAAELRSLLRDELEVQAKTKGQPPNPEMAISLVGAYRRPNEVAARYRHPWTIIAPADSKNFVRAVIIGTATLMLYGSVLDHPRWAFPTRSAESIRFPRSA